MTNFYSGRSQSRGRIRRMDVDQARRPSIDPSTFYGTKKTQQQMDIDPGEGPSDPAKARNYQATIPGSDPTTLAALQGISPPKKTKTPSPPKPPMVQIHSLMENSDWDKTPTE